jgi:hypothetical protein
MTSAPLAYPDWKAPREDGQILIWPDPPQLTANTLDNQKRLSTASDVLVQGLPLAELRRRARAWIHHESDAQPLVADGHQAELHHAGVWVKRVLTNQLAARLGGQAAHFAVDTDAPKHLHLRWLGGSEPITDDPDLSRAHWAGLLDAPSPAHVDHVEAKIAEASFAAPPVVPDFLASLRRLAIEQPKLPPALTNAMHELDWSLGLRHGALLASPLWQSEPFLVFAHHVIARAREFATVYNAALADFRREKKVRSATRPMPDLAAFHASVELPFWLDQLGTGGRTRPSVFPRNGGFVLTTPSGEEFDFDPSADAFDAAAKLNLFLRRNNLRLSPRALPLTMFLRLFVVDQFVHGIGGGQYDQITDRIIAAHFKIEPPRFSVATGTLYLPEAVGRERICVPCIEQQGHRLRHSLLGERKRELVAQIAAAPRNSPERYAAFAGMHRDLKAAAAASSKIRQWEQQLRDAVVSETAEAAIFDRELFYALQPRDRLADMVERFRRSV